MKKLILVLAILIGVIVAPSSAQATSLHLAVDTPRQTSTNFCWVAATVGIVKYLTGKQPSQCDLVRKLNYSRLCYDRTGNFQDVSTLMNHYGIDTYFYANPLSLGYVQSQIKLHRPMMASLAWPGKEVGHIVVIDGFSGDYLYIDYIRPNKTYQVKVKYSEFLSNKKAKKYNALNGGSLTIPAHRWARTYYGFRKA